MTDPTGILVVSVTFLAVVLLIHWRSITTVAPDEVGVVTILGAYQRLVRPGFNVVSPLAVVVRVKLSTRTLSLGDWSLPLATGAVPLTGTVSFRVTDARKSLF